MVGRRFAIVRASFLGSFHAPPLLRRRHGGGGWIAVLLVERDRFARETFGDRGRNRHSLAEIERRHFVLAALLQARLDLNESLAAPEAEQDALVLGADEEQRAVVEVNEMAPLDLLVE